MENNELKKNTTEKNYDFIYDIIFNVALPSLILTKLSTPEYLGQMKAFLLALSFPIMYAIIDFFKKKKFNWISGLGFISVLLTGGLGLLKLDGIWFAVKEAAIPAIIGLAVLISVKFKPLIKVIVYNDKIINVDKVNSILDSKNAHQDFNRLLIKVNYLFSLSFFLSAFLNFFLAVYILKSPSGTVEFNQELGKMNALSFPVIVLPSMVFMMVIVLKLVNGIKNITGLDIEEVLKSK
ncbi:MAG: VC0807 family protein [Candidatus Sericytochromatia bacterium]